LEISLTASLRIPRVLIAQADRTYLEQKKGYINDQFHVKYFFMAKRRKGALGKEIET